MIAETTRRLKALRTLLGQGQISTQEDLVNELRARKFVVTQSTISRDLSRLQAVKTRDGRGNIVYCLPENRTTPVPAAGLQNLLLSVRHNGSLVVIQTSPGSASLVARLLDQSRPAGVLGTIAGDDTVFVAPESAEKIQDTVKAVVKAFSAKNRVNKV
jgi:transcriptional regulator of arginine metabolism